jgi:hypothetical protein
MARRVNAAAALLDEQVDMAAAIRQLQHDFGVSARQARRYLGQAQQHGRRIIPVATVVFTVKVPNDVVDQVRHYASQSGQTISTVVSQALAQFLARVAGWEASPPEPGGRRR